jgi:anti-sigma regulatory factor (Ser/Thr protein kinase)
LTLPARATSPARARRFVAATLGTWGLDGGDAALLLVSELTTNALLHARTSMTVTLTDSGDGTVLLSVADESATVPRGRHFTTESATGRGLRLVESVSSEWGVERTPSGKTVWCRVPLGASAWTSFDVDSIEAL